MRVWPKRALKIIGVINLAFTAVGILTLSGGVYRRIKYVAAHPGWVDPHGPYAAQLFWLDAGIELALIFILALTGLWILQLRRGGRWLSNILFGFLIARVIVQSWAYVQTVTGSSLAWMANVIVDATVLSYVLGWQFIILYPPIALIGTNLAFTYLRLDERFPIESKVELHGS